MTKMLQLHAAPSGGECHFCSPALSTYMTNVTVDTQLRVYGEFCSGDRQGRNHGWKVEGDQGLGPNTGALAPLARRTGCWCGKGSSPTPCEGPGVSPPEIFWKLRCLILHSGDYLLWNFLLFENYGQEVGGPIHTTYILSHTVSKSWGPVSRGPTVVALMVTEELLACKNLSAVSNFCRQSLTRWRHGVIVSAAIAQRIQYVMLQQRLCKFERVTVVQIVSYLWCPWLQQAAL